MVSFVAQGRAGNFFFELTACIGYAFRYGLEFTVPFETSNEYWSPLYCRHLQNKNYNPYLEKVVVKETQHNFKELEFREEWRHKNIVLEGYFQSEKYFSEYKNEILALINFKWELKPVISIHARFGDYLTIPGKHILIDEPYIRKTMELMVNKTGIDTFKIFSDDLKYFKQHLGHIHDFQYSTNENEIDDLVEISCCHSHINSSSTFSWWAAWLNRNPNKIVITQNEWFQPNWDGLDTSDIIPNNWIKL